MFFSYRQLRLTGERCDKPGGHAARRKTANYIRKSVSTEA
jgi:hypothetical protein